MSCLKCFKTFGKSFRYCISTLILCLGDKVAGEIDQLTGMDPVQIKADVETQGEFVESLASEVRAASFSNVGEVVEFVNWLDDELSFLVSFHKPQICQNENTLPVYPVPLNICIGLIGSMSISLSL